jgi:phenylpropionate dioxygenase-like ring-hydroxylating dioxygenase large terminal subunit
VAFITNAWYVAAWDHEVPRGTLFNRRIIGESLLLYRRGDGTLVALDNRCPHRHAPLHLGRLEDDCVRCMYHGLKFDAQGHCIEVPGQNAKPAALRVRSYPVIEKQRWIWVWMGDPERADASTLPDTFSLDSPGWRYRPAYLHYQANHLLIADNVLDFSHLSYVHEKTLGGSAAIAGTRAHVEKLANGVHIHREVRNTAPSPLHRSLGMPAGEVDRWWTYDYMLPGVLLLDSGVRPSGEAPGMRLHFHSCQAIVPESETTSHYFFMQAHDFALENAQLTEALYQGVLTAFHEDKSMIEAQQALIDATPPAPMIGLPMDAALAQYRRLYEQALD